MAALTAPELDLLQRSGVYMLRGIMPLIAQFALWGIHILVSTFAVYRMKLRPKKTHAWLIMLVVIISLSALSTLLLFIPLFTFVLQAKTIMLCQTRTSLEERLARNGMLVPLLYAGNWISPLRFLIGDAIVIWRTWAVWRSPFAIMLPGIPWIASAAFLVAERVVFIRSGMFSSSIRTDIQTVSALSLPNYALSVVTNAVSTAMIAWKAWKHRQFVRESLGRDASTMVQRILILLVESGLIYLVIWSISSVTTINTATGPGQIFLDVWAGIGYQAAGIYPTAMIVLVELKLSSFDNLEPVFSDDPPPLPASRKTLTQKVLMHLKKPLRQDGIMNLGSYPELNFFATREKDQLEAIERLLSP